MPDELKTLDELSRPGAVGYRLPTLHLPEPEVLPLSYGALPLRYLREEFGGPYRALKLPELSERDVVRAFANRGRANVSVDGADLYPLGSCTMIDTPHAARRVDAFSGLHPWQPEETVQGALGLMYRLERILSEFGGAYKGTLQPAAGAHGELTAMLMIAAYHRSRGEERSVVLIPDSAHGTNPATAAMAGYTVVAVKSDSTGRLSMDDLESKLEEHGAKVAALMITQPNTYGIYDESLPRIAEAVHKRGGEVYCDGANFAALTGRVLLGQLGVDAFHFNLHKTFGVPHGGGGPGAGFVGIAEHLAPFLPVPLIEQNIDGLFVLSYDRPSSIGTVSSAFGNFLADVMAYQYIHLMGDDGFREASAVSVLAGNYMHRLLGEVLEPAFPGLVAHEGIVRATALEALTVNTGGKERRLNVTDLAKGLISRLGLGIFHAPTIGWPVHDGLLTEPTHSASKGAMDRFAAQVEYVMAMARADPEWLARAPYGTPSSRIQGTPQEAEANRKPVLTWDMSAKPK